MTRPEDQFSQPGDPVAADTRVETDDDDLAAVAGCTAPDYDDASDPHNGGLDRGETDAP